MKIVYDSFTGNVKRFVSRLPETMNVIKLDKDLIMEEEFVLVTYTTGFGLVPKTTKTFLENEKNKNNLVAVSASGNMNWGDNYAKSADIISEKYGVPILSKFELSGLQQDIQKFVQRVSELGNEVY